MSASAEIHAQLASILERFAKRALLEMSRAVEQEMTRRQMEVETLLLKLQFTESELRSARQNQQNLRSVGTQASSSAQREVSCLMQEDGIKSVQIKEEHMEDGQWDGGPISPALCRLEDQDSFGTGSTGAAAVGCDFILTSKMKSSGMWNSPVSEEYPVNSGSLEASPLETGNLFHVVSFVDTEEVEAVPALWVKHGVCLWPPYKDEGVQRASECSEPPLDSWAAYNVRILHTASDYAEAQRKLALVEQQMDLQSGDETDALKTRKHKTKRLLDDGDAEEENTRLTLDPQIQPPCKRSVLSAPDELQPGPALESAEASAAPALPQHQRAVGSRRGVEPSAARPDASSHSASPWLQENSLSCGDPFVRSLLHDLTTKQEIVLEQQMSLMRMVQDLQAHSVREITDADGVNQRRFPLEDLRSLSALENELRSCPETRRKVISTEIDPQLRLDDNDQQISTPDPQLKPQESNKQVTSEAEQWSDGLVSCEADDGSQKNCKHDTMYSAVSSLDKCDQCSGPFSALTWIGVRCKICSCFWHTTCYNKHVMPSSNRTPNSERLSSVELSDEDHIPDSCSEASEVFSVCELPKQQSDMPDVSYSSTAETEDPVQSSDINNEERTVNIGTTSAEERTGEDPCLETSNESPSVDKKNYCYICGKPQSKFMRHLKVHEKTNADVAYVLALPTYSKERKKLLDKLRNKGNYKHNEDVLASRTGLLKLRRKPKKKYKSEDFVHCVYCHAMFLRRDLWRHVRNCASNPVEDPEPGRSGVLTLATVSNAAPCRQMSQGVWKLLTEMKDDDISAAVRSDFCILQLAQSFSSKHGQDPTKYDYIRQKLREVGRLLLVLQRDFSIQTLEDAVRPAHFKQLIAAVRKVSGFDDEKHSHQTPSLALKLGHSLEEISSIMHCRALMAEDDEGIRSTQTFKKLYSTKWAELVSHTALTNLNEAHFNKPSSLPFTEDVQRLHQHLETVADLASESLKKTISAQAYGELCRATLAKIILFNRRRGGEVSKMQLQSFLERDAAALHTDAAGLTPFELKLCVHFSRVEIRGKRGRKVAVLLSPDMVDALTLLVSRRKGCGVPEENTFLFGRPNCLSPYRGQDCLSIYANDCGAQNPEFLRSTRLRKHVATLSQLLNLENHELEQVAEFLGLDIRVHREYYRLPEATAQLAKISNLLLAMEKDALADLQGKTLEEIQVEDQLDFCDSESEDSDADETRPITGTGTTGPVEEHPGTSDGLSFSFTDADCASGEPSQVILESAEARRKQKQIWSPAEISAVMRHFRNHISRGKSASRIECQRCKTAEHPTLAARSAQNIRDFVRNRGVSLKRKLLKNV